MNRTIALVASTVLLIPATAARGFDPYDPAVKKLMPADQLEIFEKMEALCKQEHDQFFAIKDTKKREEERQKLADASRRLHEQILNKLKTEGLKGWVGTAFFTTPDTAVMFDGWQAIRISLQMRDRKVKGPIEDALNAIKPADIIRFSTKADSGYTLPADRKSVGGIDQLIKIDTITSVEKIGTWTRPVKSPDPKKK